MKLKNKILSKLTYFDYSIIVIVTVLSLGFLFFFYRKSEHVDIRVKITDKDVLYAWTRPQNWYADRFRIGDVERDLLGRVITEIVDVQTFNVESHRKAVYLDLKVKAVYDSRTNLYSAKGKSLVFGTPIRFDLSEITFEGIVTEFPNSQYRDNYTIEEKVVDVLLRGVVGDQGVIEPEILNTINKGDKIIDSNGIVLAEVLDVRLSQALRITTTDRGELFLRYDPFYKDVRLMLKLRTKAVNNEMYVFDNLPLRVGEKIPLTFNDVFIAPTIVEIGK